MLSDESVFEFISQPDNLPAALEVAGYVEKFKKTMHERFWTKFNLRINRNLVDLNLGQTWKYKIVLRLGAYLKPWGSNSLAPIMPKDSKHPYLYQFIGQTSVEQDFRSYWGVHWSSKPENFQHPSMTKLLDILAKRNMNQAWSNSVQFGFYKYQIYSPEFLSGMYESPDELVDEVSGDFMQLFSETRALMEIINKAVSTI